MQSAALHVVDMMFHFGISTWHNHDASALNRRRTPRHDFPLPSHAGGTKAAGRRGMLTAEPFGRYGRRRGQNGGNHRWWIRAALQQNWRRFGRDLPSWLQSNGSFSRIFRRWSPSRPQKQRHKPSVRHSKTPRSRTRRHRTKRSNCSDACLLAARTYSQCDGKTARQGAPGIHPPASMNG